MKKPWDDGCYGDDFSGWHRWITYEKYIAIDKLTPINAYDLYRTMCQPYDVKVVTADRIEVQQ